jgi:UDP-GlcNAc:undecaprenyl-phosphate GlcNAc-1-phosphate transferase
MFIFPVFIASLITFFTIMFLRPFAIRINLTDKPGDRKLHVDSVPLVGGIAMYFGITISLLILPIDLNDLKYFFVASFILVIIGVFDDHRDISVSLRFLFQALVAIIIVSGADLSISSFGNLLGQGEMLIYGWAYFISVIAIITGINAVNMADGIHGLAAGNSLITFIAIVFLTFNSLSLQALWISILFCSVLPVFLVYNLCLGIPSGKRIFMGDAGSMFIGMAIAWLLIDLSQGDSRVFNPVIALWLFSAPIIDIIFAISRRMYSGNSPFKADRYHTHHLLLKLGFKEIEVLIIIMFFSFIMALIGIMGEYYEVAEQAMFFGFIVVFLVYIFWYRRTIRKIEKNPR